MCVIESARVFLYILNPSVCVYHLCLPPGDEGSGSGSGSGCTEGCTTEFDFVGTETPVVAADRSDGRAATAPASGASASWLAASSPLLTSLALQLVLHWQWR